MDNVKGVSGKKFVLFCVACFFLICCCGCDLKKEYDCNTLKLMDNGSIKEYIVEPFDSSVYSYEEFVAFNQDEINSYNLEKGDNTVVIENCVLENGNIKITINYNSADSYYDINQKVLYYDSCKKASNAGYNPVGMVKSVQNGEELDAATWNDSLSKLRIAVLYEQIDVVTPDKILYISDGVTLMNDKCAVSGEDISYIIF